MTTPTIAMTKLDAVNDMLASIGQSPVNTLTGALPKDVSKAELALDHVLRAVLTKGWGFNSDTKYPLTPDGNFKIAVPPAAMHIDPSDGRDYVMRWDTDALRVYDTEKRSFNEFTDGAVDFDIIWAFDFEEIPQHARQYVAMRAGRKFQAGIIGSQILYQFTKEMEMEAEADFKRIEHRTKQYNMIRNSNIVNRRYNTWRG